MIHYSCDLCGRALGQERFEVKIEVAPAFDPDEITEDDLHADNLQKIASELAAMESTDEFELEETGPKKFNYDFCAECATKFVKAPLQPAPTGRVSFSRN